MDLSGDVLLAVLVILVITNIVLLITAFLVGRGRKDRAGGTAGGASMAAATGGSGPAEDDLLTYPTMPRSMPAEVEVESPVTFESAAAAAAAEDADAEAIVDAETTVDPEATVDTEADEASATTEPDPSDDATPDPGPDTPIGGADGTVVGRDPLTGLLDATAWSNHLVDEDARVQRYHRPATVVLLELDGMDRLVARLGPEAGERIVPAMADTLTRLARNADHVARLGTGRFGVLMPETDEVAAINYVERIRRACELWLESGAIALRLSIGWAASSGEPDLLEVQRVATERMFVELRRHGRRDGDVSVPADLGGDSSEASPA